MPYLNWIGKDKVINYHMDVQYRILKEVYTFNSNSDSGNMIIKGDNIYALKSLLPKYENRIKCIYIDPPYNTGKEGWKYNDKVNDPKIREWLDQVVGKEGDDLSRHDKWLCMMYPRLKLLEKLLSDDGIIFISIDDNEQANLRIICDDIFGIKNFVAQFAWKTDGNFDNQAKVKICHQYILCYVKKTDVLGLPHGVDATIPENSKIFNDYIRNTVVKNGPKNPKSNIVIPAGFPCAVKELDINERYDEFPNYLTKAKIRDGKLVKEAIVNSGWSSKDILMAFINNGMKPVLDTKGQETSFEITQTGNIEMIKKRKEVSHIISTLSGLGSTQNMSSQLKKMGISFDYPKPVQLIEFLLNFYSDEDSIILDAFAGTGTTAHAVLNMNKKDNGNRKFILIELGDYAESITAKRVKCVINGYEGVEGTGGDFTFYEVGSEEEGIFNNEGYINEKIPETCIKEYIWYLETKTPYHPNFTSKDIEHSKYYLGKCNNTAYYFIYEKDKSTQLNHKFLSNIKTKAESYVIYADTCTLSETELTRYNIGFRKIPRDITIF